MRNRKHPALADNHRRIAQERRHPRRIEVCALLDKHESREVEVPIDYSGFRIGKEFVVGYGLDFNERYRNLPYIGVVEMAEK